ncbi:hypothetical protein [Streptomyces mirabilis]|uniref:hypothetical protein n=1 Tax=Streptomyces mirabilis TaxID=68239 RepID=UPI002E231425
MQQRNVGERLLRALYALAAEYSTSAAWSRIDARNLDQAQRHLNESAPYVGLSQDGPPETRLLPDDLCPRRSCHWYVGHRLPEQPHSPSKSIKKGLSECERLSGERQGATLGCGQLSPDEQSRMPRAYAGGSGREA